MRYFCVGCSVLDTLQKDTKTYLTNNCRTSSDASDIEIIFRPTTACGSK